jgi:hypothetical protein
MGLNLPSGGAALPALNHETEDREPHRVAECTELLGVAFQFGWHRPISNKFDLAHKRYF